MEKVNQKPAGRLISDPYDGHRFVPRIDGDWSMLGQDLYTAPQVAQPVAFLVEGMTSGDPDLIFPDEREGYESTSPVRLTFTPLGRISTPSPAPVAQPLTRSQREAVFAVAQEAMYADPELSWRHAIITATERAHGIGQGVAPQVAQPLTLTDEQIQATWNRASGSIPGWSRHIAYARAIERACAEKWGVKLAGQEGGAA